MAQQALRGEDDQRFAVWADHLAAQQIDFKILSGDNPDTVRATVAPLGGVTLPWDFLAARRTFVSLFEGNGELGSRAV